MKSKQWLFAAFIFVLLLAVGVYAPIASYLEEKELARGLSAGIETPAPTEHTGFFAPVLNAVENVKYIINDTYANYIPFYMLLLQVRNETLADINRPSYSLLAELDRRELEKRKPQPSSPDTETTAPSEDSSDDTKTIPVIKDITDNIETELLGEMGVNRYYKVSFTDKNGERITFLEGVQTLKRDDLEARLAKQIKEINRIATSDKTVNFCVYVASNMQDAEFFPDFFPSEICYNSYREEFIASLDESINAGYLDMESVFDRLKYDYITDHHWSGLGAYQGYSDVISLLRRDAPAILEARPLGTPVLIEDCRFYGSYARNYALASIWDDFVVYDYDLPTHTSVPACDFDTQVERVRSLHNKSLNSNIYGTFYPATTEYHYPENNTGRNLLIFADSYTQGFAELLASSFDNTLIIYYGQTNNLDYNAYIAEHGITDVLLCQFNTRLLFDSTNDSRLDLIKTADGGAD